MERKEEQTLLRWNQNRAGTLLIFGISLILLSFCAGVVGKIIGTSIDNKQKSIDLIKTSENLENNNIKIILENDEVYQQIKEYDQQNNKVNVIDLR